MLRTANGGTVEDARQSVLDALGGISIGRGANRAAAIHGATFVIDSRTISTV